ncbi:MAG: hypothetical protein ACP5JW_07305 [Candidatus Bathyarchaeia archaeon]
MSNNENIQGSISHRDYLHEKVEESKHNETVAYLMSPAGTVFFVGGILENLLISNNYQCKPRLVPIHSILRYLFWA